MELRFYKNPAHGAMRRRLCRLRRGIATSLDKQAFWCPELRQADVSTQSRQRAKYSVRSPTHVEPAENSAEPKFEFRKKAQFAWKVFTLFVTFVALIPVLLYQDQFGAQIYLWFLVVIHVLGLIIFTIGVRKEDLAPSKWGFYGRLIGLGVTVVLLYWASQGLTNKWGTMAFWWSLFLIWAIHTGGLALLHIRGRSEKNCPFV
jgi:hypothetical protein